MCVESSLTKELVNDQLLPLSHSTGTPIPFCQGVHQNLSKAPHIAENNPVGTQGKKPNYLRCVLFFVSAVILRMTRKTFFKAPGRMQTGHLLKESQATAVCEACLYHCFKFSQNKLFGKNGILALLSI